jgi:TRAP-type mannitol/chloroaromatic compound transport system permease small subunit
MDQKIMVIILLTLPLVMLIAVAVGAFLSSWSVAEHWSKLAKRLITIVTTLIILAFLVFLARWSGIKNTNLVKGIETGQTSVPNS